MFLKKLSSGCGWMMILTPGVWLAAKPLALDKTDGDDTWVIHAPRHWDLRAEGRPWVIHISPRTASHPYFPKDSEKIIKRAPMGACIQPINSGRSRVRVLLLLLFCHFCLCLCFWCFCLWSFVFFFFFWCFWSFVFVLFLCACFFVRVFFFVVVVACLIIVRLGSVLFTLFVLL